MAVMGYLDDDAEGLVSAERPLHHAFAAVVDEQPDKQAAEGAARANPNVNSGFSAALSCYP